MLVSEAKKEFLKKVKKVDVVDFAKKILPYQMLGYRTYDIITGLNINQGTKPIKKEALLLFYKNIYDIWYDFVLNLDEDKYSGKTFESIRKIKKDKRFEKSNMTPMDCEKFIFEVYDREFSGSGLRPLNSQSGRIVDEDFADFVHVYPFIMPRNISCRLYLNLKPEYILELGKILTEKCYQKHYRIYYKFWTGMNDRNDTFLIYTNYNRVQKIVDILKEIKNEKPEIFAGAEKSSGILSMIDGFIGFGEEPVYKHSSFNSERGESFDEYFRELLKKQAKLIRNYTGTIHNSKGEDLHLREYLKYRLEESFKETLRARQIEILNRQYPETYKTDKQIGDYIAIQTKIYEKCKDKLPDFVEKQVDDNVEKIITNLKSGIFPNNPNIVFKTQRISLSGFTEKYAQEVIKKYGSLNYYFELDLDLRQKLFEIFNVRKKIDNEISEESIKPYFDKHHVSIKNPSLNLETEIELDGQKKK